MSASPDLFLAELLVDRLRAGCGLSSAEYQQLAAALEYAGELHARHATALAALRDGGEALKRNDLMTMLRSVLNAVIALEGTTRE